MNTLELKPFIHHFCNNIRADKKYCFILGSGASKQSGIPTGGELVKQWLEELDKMYGVEYVDNWLKTQNIKRKEAAKCYPDIYDKRFEVDQKEGYAFLEKIMEGKEPSCGYSVLAQILANKLHKIVITTNFDSLTEDALFIYTQRKPLVIGHEVLANFIKPFGDRPIIVKIHRDFLLSPKSKLSETKEIETDFKKNLASVFKYYTPLVIGYGGNDGSLMGFLESLDEIEGGIFWFHRKTNGNLDERIQKLIEKFSGYAVPIDGFDELMIELGNELKIERLDNVIKEIADKRVKGYRDQVEEIQKAVTTKTETKDALSEIISRGTKDWWTYQLMAAKETDIDKKEEIYKEGLKILPNSPELNCNYAIFLSDIRKEYDKAEEFYKKAIELDPNKSSYTNNYAVFLSNDKKDFDKAEKLYKKAIELDANNAHNIHNYAIFLKNIRKDFDKAEALYKKAIELDANNAHNIHNYAIFLKNIRKDFDKAEALYKKAIELDANNASYTENYAIFLSDVGKDFDKAEELYKKAIELGANDARYTENYAIFLKKIRNNFDKAEELYKKAIELDLNNANNIHNYAIFLKNIRKDFNKAEELYKKAIELDLSKVGGYALFLHDVRKDFDKAEVLYKKAIELDPKDANDISNYAKLNLEINKIDKANELIKESFELNKAVNNETLELELWFYCYAIFPDEYKDAPQNIERLLAAGIKSPGWNLKGVLDRAKKRNHPDYEKLCVYEKKITEE